MDLFPTFPLLENWYFAQPKSSTEKESKTKYIVVGNIYNHEGFDDGELIRSTPVKTVDFDRGLVKTSDKTYMLGRPHKEWVEWMKTTKQDQGLKKFLVKFDLKN